MDKRTMMAINAVGVAAVLAFLALCWLYLREQFMWGVIFSGLVLLSLAYANLPERIPGQGLKALDTVTIIAVLVILCLSWLFLPRESFGWAVNVCVLIVVLLALFNFWKVANTGKGQ
jgi:hypothetical protein